MSSGGKLRRRLQNLIRNKRRAKRRGDPRFFRMQAEYRLLQADLRKIEAHTTNTDRAQIAALGEQDGD